MARLTRRRHVATAVGLLGAIAAISTGAWGLREWAPFAKDAAPVTWPHNVQPLVDFVQGETQLRFLHAVHVEFMADAEAFHRRAVPATDPSVTAQAAAHADEGLGRALGWWANKVDLVADAATIRDSGDFAAVWLRAEDTIVVRAKDAQATLTPLDRADLLAPLTEALDEQNFHVFARGSSLHSAESVLALAGVDFGQVAWVRERYVRRFNADDKTAFNTAAKARSIAYSAKVDPVPPAYRALRLESQELGAAFIAALRGRGGARAVANAFTGDVPNALDQLSMPSAKYVRRDRPETVTAPAAPNHAELLGHRQLGPFGVYMVLATGLPPTEALAASDGWGNDDFVVYRLNGRVCVDGRIVADTTGDADRLERALDAWGHARPSQVEALVGRKGTTLLLSACDPGESAGESTVTVDAINQYFGRAEVLAQQIVGTGQPARAECIAVSAFDRYSSGDLRGANPAVDGAAILTAIGADCDSSI